MEKSSPLVSTFRKQRNTVEWKMFNITVEHLESETVGVEGPVPHYTDLEVFTGN